MFLSQKQKNITLYRQSLELLPRQISDTIKKGKWTNAGKLRPVKTIIVNGMGGSNLGIEIVRSLFKKNLELPVMVDPGYEAAGYVTKNTAYIVSSYSGTTEEPIAAYRKAKQRRALVIALTSDSDNKLATMAKRDGTPLFQFPTAANPSKQPRLGLGLSMAGFILILNKLGALKNSIIKDFLKAAKRKNSDAALVAKRLKNREIVLIGSPCFEGNLKTMRNQLSESAKNLTSYLTLPDMNHFALEGLQYPKSNKKRLAALFIDSKLDDPRIQKRAELSKEIFRKNRIPVISHSLSGKTSLEQGLELLQFGGWLSYYIAIQNRVDPMQIKSVDWFKKNLSN